MYVIQIWWITKGGCMRFGVVVSVLVLALASPALADKDTYTKADLEALAKESAWDELLTHAKDLKPSERDTSWKQLVEQAAVGRLKDIKDADFKWSSVDGVQSALDGIAEMYPHLKTSKPFALQGGLTMVRALKACMNDSYCKESDVDFIIKVNQFVKERKDPEIACAAGEMLLTRMTGYTALLSFELAVDKGKTSACCKSASVPKAISDGMEDKDYMESAKKVANKCGLKAEKAKPETSKKK
jgi:hypothetical protein